MTIASNAARITLNGALPCGEGWQASFYVAKDDATEITLDGAEAYADGWMGGFIDAGPNLMGQYDPGTTFGSPAIQMIDGATGAGLEKGVGTITAAGTEGSAGGPLPPQAAVVITLRGSDPLDKVHGRFYLPAPLAVCVNSKGRMRDETIGRYADAIAQAATEASLATSAAYKMAIWSAVNGAVVIARRAEIGDVFANQRSRRQKLVERRTPILIGTAF